MSSDNFCCTARCIWSRFLVPQKAEHIEFAYGKYIGFALADISSLREQTYRLCSGFGVVVADKRAEVWGLANMARCVSMGKAVFSYDEGRQCS